MTKKSRLKKSTVGSDSSKGKTDSYRHICNAIIMQCYNSATFQLFLLSLVSRSE